MGRGTKLLGSVSVLLIGNNMRVRSGRGEWARYPIRWLRAEMTLLITASSWHKTAIPHVPGSTTYSRDWSRWNVMSPYDEETRGKNCHKLKKKGKMRKWRNSISYSQPTTAHAALLRRYTNIHIISQSWNSYELTDLASLCILRMYNCHWEC